MDTHAIQATVRFGLGARGTEPPPADPAVWLRRQITEPDPTRLDPPPSTVAGLTALRHDRQNKGSPDQREVRPLFRAELTALLTNALTTPAPFRERLVWFWTNHFTVSTRQGGVAAVAGAFVQEAIRPHVTGRFARHAAGGDAPSGDADLSEQRRSRSAPTAAPARTASAA